MKTKILFFSIFLIFTHTFSQAQNKQLMGTWKATNGSLMIFANNTVQVANDTYAYQIYGDQLTMFDQSGNTISYTYKIQNAQLYLYLPNVGTYVMSRVQANNRGYNQQRTHTNSNTRSNTGNLAANRRLYGTFCSYSSSGYSGSSSYSTTQRVYFDGQGHYQYGSQSSYSGNGDVYGGGDGGYSGTYRVVGNQGVVLTASDGSQYRVAIYFVQDSGEITELKYDGTVYAKSLCD